LTALAILPAQFGSYIMTQNFHPLLQRAQSNGIHFEINGAVATVRLSRPQKRNALSDGLVEALRDVFQNLPEEVKAAVIHGEGDHFCAGLDLSELKERDASQGVYHSRSWHLAVDAIQLGRVPVIAALHGAVVGGGLELASACHIRVADDSTFFALPEGTRGIVVGGGGSAIPGSAPYQNAGGTGSNSTFPGATAASGGGGWGASGGNVNYSGTVSGGTGGKAINLNGYSVTYITAGDVWGAVS
jgi:enoyl-CoA hydratase/carnithine racemase